MSRAGSANTIEFGRYKCRRCGKDYIFNDGTWRRCTGELCHDCCEHLETLYALVPYPEREH